MPNLADDAEPAEKNSALPFYAGLEKELKAKQREAERLAEQKVDTAIRENRSRIARHTESLREREAAQRRHIAQVAETSTAEKLEAERAALAELEVSLLQRKDQAVRFGLAWILGEEAP